LTLDVVDEIVEADGAPAIALVADPETLAEFATLELFCNLSKDAEATDNLARTRSKG
jgi:hypothetical protein